VDGLLESPWRVLVTRKAVEALQGKMCQNSLPSGVGRSLGAKISGERVVPGEYFLVSTKLDTFCYPTVETALWCRRFDTIPAYDGQTDRQTDGRTRNCCS